jgi:ubiquitin carboxyl-terminal hydrolase L5
MCILKNILSTCINHNGRTTLPYCTFYSELLQLLGTPLVMDEVYSLDPATLEQQPPLAPMQALIFLFKWIAELETAEGDSLGGKGPKTGGTYEHDFAGFFARQVCSSPSTVSRVHLSIGRQ